MIHQYDAPGGPASGRGIHMMGNVLGNVVDNSEGDLPAGIKRILGSTVEQEKNKGTGSKLFYPPGKSAEQRY